MVAVARAEAFCASLPSLGGRRVLVIDDPSGALSTAIVGRAGWTQATVSTGSEARRHPLRALGCPVDVVDLAAPWKTAIDERFDLVVTLDGMRRTTEPRALLEYCQHLGSRFVVELEVSGEGDEPTRNASGDANVFPLSWLEAASRRLELDLSVKKSKGATRVCTFSRRCEKITPLLVHIHIPKTAGQSFNALLDRSVAKGKMARFYPPQPSKARWDVVTELVNQPPLPKVLSLHAGRLHVPSMLGSRLPLYVSIVRDPYKQVLSYLKFVKQEYTVLLDAHKKLLPAKCPEMSVEELLDWHIKHVAWRDFGALCTPVSWMTERPDLERAKEIFGRFLMIGVTEQLDRSVRVLSRLLEPYDMRLAGRVPRVNTTAKLATGGLNLREHRGFRQYSQRFMDLEDAFFEWAVQRFERQASRLGIE